MTTMLRHDSSQENRWFHDETAQAFWDQHRALPYRELLQDTIRWCAPQSGERWLDLGCGGGHLTAALWNASGGKVASIHAADCAVANRDVIAALACKLKPAPKDQQITFSVVDFSKGLDLFEDSSFDGIVSGLAISYAEFFDEKKNIYTDEAYNRLYHELFRVLKPGGKLVFSVNVPNPDFWRIVWKSMGRGVKLGRPWKTIKNVWNMQRHGAWLKKEAQRGRFHFLPLEAIEKHLEEAGFAAMESKLSYADQAYVVHVDKPTPKMLSHVA
ncbi:MAG TPA: class I SAM-dependent methyltransferase [Gemmatales bacterium]|nr:class I SAM-dependent methyltransferase [Gemmatales bacterium]